MQRIVMATTLVLSVVTVVLPVPSVQAVNTYEYECGTNNPPSGPYVDLTLMKLMDYDCETGILTLQGGITDSCSVEIVEGYHVPVWGVCLVLNQPDSTIHQYSWRGLVALVGSYPTIAVRTWEVGQYNNVEVDCSGCGGVVLSDPLVTFWTTPQDNTHSETDCDPHESTGRLQVAGTSGTHSFGSETNAYWCAAT